MIKRLSPLVLIFLALVFGVAATTVVDLTFQVRGILPSANGGTGSAFFAISGPTALRTFTYPDSDQTVETQNNKNVASGYAGLTAGSVIACSQAPALTGNVTTSAGSCATTIANSAVTNAMVDNTVSGLTIFSNTVINPAAATDTQLAEFTLSTSYLNTANKGVWVYSHVVHTTGSGQTPTIAYKWKLCTVSGCGSGTALVLATLGTTGDTASGITGHAELQAWVVTTASGSGGSVESSGWGLINIQSNAATGSAQYNDVNTAAQSIALNATVYLDLTGRFSTQSGTPSNGMVARITTLKPID